MGTYTVTYLPHHREDKEWVDVEGTSVEDVKKNFKGGTIINITQA